MKKYLVVILLFLFCCLSVIAQTTKIKDLQRKQQILQEEISNTNKLYLDVRKQTTTILERIELINKQIGSRKEMIELQQQEIKMLAKEQSDLEKEIAELDQQLKLAQKSYAKAIQSMIKNNRFSENKLMFILSGKSFGETLRRMQYLKNYSNWRREQAEEIKKQNIALVIKKEELQKSKTARQSALNSLQAEHLKLQKEEKVRQSEMKEARGKESELKKTLQNKQKQVNQLNSQIEKLIAEEVMRQEREAEVRRIAAEKAERKRKTKTTTSAREKESLAKDESHTTEKTIAKAESEKSIPAPKVSLAPKSADTEDFDLSSDFASNKGRLPLPVTGPSTIVANFGANRSNEWNITTNSNGIDIQTQQGANIRSVFQGVVSKVFSFPGSNTCIIIRHGEYYTFYGNIFDLYVKQGDKVNTGQALGKIFTDPDTGIAKMHFQLWKKTVKMDPKPWLKR